MKYPYLAACVVGLAVVAGAARAGSVEVAFVHPESFTDVRDNNSETADNLRTISEYLQALGRKYLPPGQVLHVDVLNVDLAGKLHPTRRWGMVRVLGGPLDWPQMSLRYRLEEQGRVLASGEDSISDMAYAAHLGSYPGWEALQPEKRLLRDWFRSHFSGN